MHRTCFSAILPVSDGVQGTSVGVSASSSASASSCEAKEDGVLLRDDDGGQASEGSKFRSTAGWFLDTLARSLSYSSAARRSTFLYLKDGEGERRRMDVKTRKKQRTLDNVLSVSALTAAPFSVLDFAKSPQTKPLVTASAKVPEFIKKNTKKPPTQPFSPLQLPCHFTSSESNPTSLLYLAPLIVHKAFGAFITHFLQHKGSLSCSPLSSCPLYPNAQLSAAVQTCNNREEEEGGVQGEGQERRMREMGRS